MNAGFWDAGIGFDLLGKENGGCAVRQCQGSWLGVCCQETKQEGAAEVQTPCEEGLDSAGYSKNGSGINRMLFRGQTRLNNLTNW